MEPVVEIARRLRFVWAATLALLTVAFALNIAPVADASAARWAMALIFPVMATVPLYLSWPIPLRLATAWASTVMLPISIGYAFAPGHEVLDGLPYMAGASVAVFFATLVVTFLLSPLFRRA
jgi:hypothetical protein